MEFECVFTSGATLVRVAEEGRDAWGQSKDGRVFRLLRNPSEDEAEELIVQTEKLDYLLTTKRVVKDEDELGRVEEGGRLVTFGRTPEPS